MDLLSCALEAAVEATKHSPDSIQRSEPWIQSYIACRLNDAVRRLYGDTRGTKRGVYVTVEAKAAWLLDQTDANPRPGRPNFTGQERIDIAVWSDDANGKVLGLVEVKNNPNLNETSFKKDARRLAAALRDWGPNRGGTLRWGLYIFSVSPNARVKTKDSRFRALEYLFQGLPKSEEDREFIVRDQNFSWAGVLVKAAEP